MQDIIGQVVAWLLLVLGLSYIANTPMWLRVVRDAMAEPARYFFIVILTLVLGLLIIATHNVWVADWPVVVTLPGCKQRPVSVISAGHGYFQWLDGPFHDDMDSRGRPAACDAGRHTRLPLHIRLTMCCRSPVWLLP